MEIRERIANCMVSIVLDKRHPTGDKYPLSVRFCIDRKYLYFPLGESLTEKDYNRIVSTDVTLGKGKPDSPSMIHRAWRKKLRGYADRVGELSETTILSLDKIKILLTGRSNENNFISVWMQVVKSKKIGTANSYAVALKSFMRCLGMLRKEFLSVLRSGYYAGADNIEEWVKSFGNPEVINKLGFGVDAAIIHKWVDKLTDEGKTKATIGIYLRSCRVVVNECIRRGLIEQRNYPFNDKDPELVSVPKGGNRKHEYLNKKEMTQLYDVFINKFYPKSWSDARKKEINESLGLFLFMYLGNGLNLADVANLRYDDFYRLNNGAAIRFERQKTASRTDDNSEVIIPVIPELKTILDELAAPYEANERLFPFLLKGARLPKEVQRKVQQGNQNIKKRMRCLVQSLGWEKQVSPTWCRHSFATVLTHSGTPQRYISEAMGHSTNGNVTMGYVAEFPLEMQMEYNARLLDTMKPEPTKELDERIRALSEEQRNKLMDILMKWEK